MPVTDQKTTSPTDNPKRSRLALLLATVSLFVAGFALLLAITAINKVDKVLPATQPSVGAPAEITTGPNQ